MNNTTTANNATEMMMMKGTLFSVPGFIAFFVALDVIIVVTAALLAVTTVAAVVAKSIPTIVRIFILNQLIACIVYQFSPALTITTSIALNAIGEDRGSHLPPVKFCQFLSWLVAFGASSRSWSVTMFAIFVLAITINGLERVKVWHSVVSIVALWLFSFLICVYAVIPYPEYNVYAVTYFDNVHCVPRGSAVPRQIGLSTTVLWIILAAGLPLIITVIIPIITLCYIKHKTLLEGAEYNKKIAKFALFLVTGTVMNFLARAVPLVLLSTLGGEAAVSIGLVILSLSTIPTPLIVIWFMKPIRKVLLHLFTLKYCRRQTIESKEAMAMKLKAEKANQM